MVILTFGWELKMLTQEVLLRLPSPRAKTYIT